MKRNDDEGKRGKIKISENLCSIRNDTNCPLRETLSVYTSRPFSAESALVVGNSSFGVCAARHNSGRAQDTIKKEGKSESDDTKFLILTRWLFNVLCSFIAGCQRKKKREGSRKSPNDVQSNASALISSLLFNQHETVTRKAESLHTNQASSLRGSLIKFMQF